MQTKAACEKCMPEQSYAKKINDVVEFGLSRTALVCFCIYIRKELEENV